MKIDKETVIVFLVCIAIIISWGLFFPRQKSELVEDTPTTQQVQNVPVQQTAVPVAASPLSSKIPFLKKPVVKPGAFTLSNAEILYKFNSIGTLNEITLKTIRRSKDNSEPLVLQEPEGFEPCTIDIPGWDLRFVSAKKVSADVLRIDKKAVSPSGITFNLIQTFELIKNSTALKSSFWMQDAPSGFILPSAIVWSGTLPPISEMTGETVMREVHQIEYSRAGSHKVTMGDAIVDTSKLDKFMKHRTGDPLEWVAVSNKYFLSILTTTLPFNGGCELRTQTVNNAENQYALPKIGGVYSSVKLPASYEMVFYPGLKEMKRMKALPESAFGAIHLAYWGWLEPISRPMLWMLNLLKDITGSYGLAIILLTVLVKLVLWPLIHRGNKSMRKIQKLQPIMKELKERYKDNQQEFSQKMAELYKKEGVNPLGGCLPMFLQIPVFIALYSTLDAAVELRHVPFLWATDLSRPDQIGPDILFGVGIHPLIIISTLLTVVQMKLTPSTGDQTQQKVMMLMPVMMLFFFYNFPSGLALYWTVNNILSILQMKYSQYSAAKEEAAEASAKAK